MRSVLQDWVMELPLREQGTLLTGVRGCDLAPKGDADLASVERHVVAFLRWSFLNPADPREVDRVAGCWFRSRPPIRFRASMLMHYPLHWYSHVMHVAEVVGYRHPDAHVRFAAYAIYLELVHGLHLIPETREQMVDRLAEDRIASNKVVS